MIPSLKTIAQAFPHPCKGDLRIARRVGIAMQTLKPDDAMDEVNKALEGHGVERIPFDDESDSWQRGTLSTYVNMGDTYDPTIIWDAHKGRFLVTSWGDFVEWSERKGRAIQ